MDPFDVYLVRHGRPLARWIEARDEGLNDAGHGEAQAIADELSGIQPIDIVTSPLVRARETALPLIRQWSRSEIIDDRFQEVPLSDDRASREAWLAEADSRVWHDVPALIKDWRRDAWEALASLTAGAVIFTHFMTINALLSRITNDNRLVTFEPDYGSVTRLRCRARGDFELVTLGRSL